MAQLQCSITIVAGLTHSRCGVALLSYPLPYVDAQDVFNNLSKSSDRYHRKSFDYWMGNHAVQHRFHGFNQSYHSGKYVNCFVFKNIGEKERFYGFLCHPKEGSDYEMCVLVLYAQKKENATDLAELDRVERVRVEPDVLIALKDPKLFTEGVGKNYE